MTGCCYATLNSIYKGAPCAPYLAKNILIQQHIGLFKSESHRVVLFLKIKNYLEIWAGFIKSCPSASYG